MNRSPKLYSLPANEPVLLNDPKTVWVVQSGTLAVFAARVKNSTVEDGRRYLFHVSVGEVLLPEGAAREWGFVAIAIEPTQLCQISMADLVKEISTADSQAIELFQGWVNHLGQSLSAQQTVLTTPLNLTTTSIERDFSLSPGETLQQRQSTILWVKLQQGSTRRMGVEELRLDSASPGFPLGSAMWLEAENPVIGQMLLTAEMKDTAEILTGLVCLHSYFFHYFSLLANQEAGFRQFQKLRRQLGVVLQNGKIGTGSVFENITAGALVSLEEAWTAAQMAGLADDIKQMPMGMHTIIAEGGNNLSGGQRQRLLIARSLVSKPKIILMDEATSALDNRTQAIVTESLAKLNATRIVIAHRLSTIRHADRIYVIDAGNVVQVGNFSELIAQEGLFARLVARQLESNV